MVLVFRKITVRESKFFGWLNFIRRKSHKMLSGLLARRWCKSPKTFVNGKVCRKKAWSREGRDCWPCMALHLPLFSMYNLRYKSSFWKSSCGPCSLRLGLPVSFFLFLFLFQVDPLEHRGPEFTFLPRLLRLSQECALCLLSIERAPEAFMNRTSPMQGLYWLSV